MTTYTFTGLTGSDGLLTFNFFCESLVGALHTLHHVLEDNGAEMPEKASGLPKALADMGSHLLEDYGKNELHLDRFKQELLAFYELAFTVNDELAPIILKGDDGLQYYYYVYMQGVNLFFPNILEGILRDLPEGTDPQPFITDISRSFAVLSSPQA